MTNVLVLGGAGYIGSHTCKQLRAAGLAPVTFDNLSEGHAEFVKWGELIVGDIRNIEEVSSAIARVRPVAAIHFAAHAYVGESVSKPEKYYQNNVAGSLNVIQALHEAKDIPVIFSSTCAVYGEPSASVICEDLPKAPINPYGRSKLMVEQILRDFSAAYDMRSVCLRYFNASGADSEGDVGEAHREETHLIPRAILAGLGRISDFAIFGNDYDTPDGSAVRDFVHVTDLADAHVAACRYLLEGGKTEEFNVGSGKGHSVFEIVEAVANELGRPVPYTMMPRREGDPPKLVADPQKALRVLGFETRHSNLQNIVGTALSWHERDRAPSSMKMGQRQQANASV